MQPISSIQYCTRCCIPETQEGVSFDDFGICTACQSQEQKMRIDWTERQAQLEAILNEARTNSGDNYDCIVPISGGKDSVFQLHVLTKVYGMRPLAVTFSHNWYSEVGYYNLVNALEVFEVDHIMFTPNRRVINELARSSLSLIGDSCWHCHAGVGAFPLNIAVKFNVPLLVWGESIADYSGRATHDNPVLKFDRDYFHRVSAKKLPEELVSDRVSKRDLTPFRLPEADECERVGLHGIHLGDYMFWDEERQTEFVKSAYGWKEDEIEGTYKRYKSAECIMPGVHDYSNYLKRGYGRTTFHASMDVRSGLLARAEAFALIQDLDSLRPDALDYYLEITGLSEAQFEAILRQQRHEKIRNVELTAPVTSSPGTITRRPFVLEFIRKHREMMSSE